MSAAPLFSALLLAVPSDSASPLRTHAGEQRTAIPVATVRPIAALPFGTPPPAVPSDSASPLRTHPGEQRTAIPVATVRPIAALRDTVNGSCLPTGEKELVAAV